MRSCAGAEKIPQYTGIEVIQKTWGVIVDRMREGETIWPGIPRLLNSTSDGCWWMVLVKGRKPGKRGDAVEVNFNTVVIFE